MTAVLCKSGWADGGIVPLPGTSDARRLRHGRIARHEAASGARSGVSGQHVTTFTATIFVGFRVGRSAETPKRIHSLDEARRIVQRYVDAVGLCVTVTPTEYVYTKGGEPGCIVGLINYPRFPSTPEQVRAHALELAQQLLDGLGQFKVSVVFPDETVMLGESID